MPRNSPHQAAPEHNGEPAAPGGVPLLRNQLSELWLAVHADVDDISSVPDLTSMSIHQLRQVQEVLIDSHGREGLDHVRDNESELHRNDLARAGRSRVAACQRWRVNEEAINQLPVAKPGHECAICCQPIGDEPGVALPCSRSGCASHFHTCCICPWLQRRPNCPLCRAASKNLVMARAEMDCSASREDEATSRTLTNARVFAGLCRIQALQLSRLSAPSVQRSMIVGLFNRTGSFLIPTSSRASWLRSQDNSTGSGSQVQIRSQVQLPSSVWLDAGNEQTNICHTAGEVEVVRSGVQTSGSSCSVVGLYAHHEKRHRRSPEATRLSSESSLACQSSRKKTQNSQQMPASRVSVSKRSPQGIAASRGTSLVRPNTDAAKRLLGRISSLPELTQRT